MAEVLITLGIIGVVAAMTMPVFAVDINGFKKPNKGGYDLFVFNITKRLSSLYIDGGGLCGFNSKGGKTVNQMIEYIYK